MTNVVRPASFDDRSAVSELLENAGWPTRSAAGWNWLFRDNPCRGNKEIDAPIGWVIESDYKLHGYLANIPLDYTLAGAPVRAATCSSYYVSEDARAEGFKLLAAFFRQANVSLFLSTTANEASAPLYKMFKAASPTEQSFQKSCFWVTDAERLIRDVCRTKKYLPNVLAIGAPILAPALRRGLGIFRRGNPIRVAYDGEIRRVLPQDIGKEFDDLWHKSRSEQSLLVRRDAEMLRWYLSDPDAHFQPELFAAYDKFGLAGYVIAGRHQPGKNAIARHKLIDLILRDDTGDATVGLVGHLCLIASEKNAGLLEVPRGGATQFHRMVRHRPVVVEIPGQSHFVRSKDRKLTAEIVSHDGWAATGLDGDGLFSLYDASMQYGVP